MKLKEVVKMDDSFDQEIANLDMTRILEQASQNKSKHIEVS